jgi:hypothetical protein
LRIGLIIGGVLMTGLALSAPTWAALPATDDNVERPDRVFSGVLVQRAQSALSRLGLYLGVEDGRMNASTQSAIEIYQRSNGLEPTGQLTPNLVGQMEYAVGVRRLLQKLETARNDSLRDARSKLMAHPATRDLVTGESNTDRADPTRDPSACFATPTASCLLKEAAESAKAIARAEMRDWALGEILIAQARAGLGALAMETARKIDDPRLVMVALRDIAEAQAASGRAKDALDAATIIPDPDKRADALIAISEIQLRRGDKDDATATVDRLIQSLNDVLDTLKQVAYRSRAAAVLAGAGNLATAEDQLAIAEADARALPRASSQSAGLRHVASAFASIAETDRALELLSSMSSASDHVPVLMSAAEAQARAGDAAAAMATASSIEAIRFRAVALGRIALAQAQAGSLADADVTLEIAMAAVERVKRPYARSFAISKIALAMTQIYDWTPDLDVSIDAKKDMFRRAIQTAETIDDRRLRAHTLWVIAARQKATGGADWETTEALARSATASIVGGLSRVWMYADLAEGHANEGEDQAAWHAFEEGIAIAETIDNAWSRARILAKLAATMIHLVDPGSGRAVSAP